MLWEEEAQLLSSIVQNNCRLEGALVDLGSFTGSSTYYMAQALDAIADGKDTRIHSFDQFILMHRNGADLNFIRKNFGENLSKGDSFRFIFDRNIAPFKHRIETHAGNLLEYQWTEGRIELLFIDLAKTQPLNSKVITEFFPHLEPELSLVLHQDFHWPALPWITVTMHLMRDCFELYEDKVGTTRAWRCKKSPNTGLIQKCAQYNFSKSDELDIVSEFIDEERAMGRDTLPFEIMKLNLGSSVETFDYDQNVEVFKSRFKGNSQAEHWEKHFLVA